LAREKKRDTSSRTRPLRQHRPFFAWLRLALAAISGSRPSTARAEPEPRGREASWLPTAPSHLMMKVHTAVLSFEPEHHSWQVSTHSELVATDARAAQATLAIPEYGCAAESEFEDGCDETRSSFAALDVSVDGRELALKKTPGKPRTEQDPTALWSLPLRFDAGAAHVLEQHYRVPAGESGEGGFSVSYVLRGGTSWAKPYGRATFKFLIPAHSCLVVEPVGVPRKSRRVLPGDPEPQLELVYEAYVLTPVRDLSLYFEPCIPARDTELAGCSVSAQLARRFYAPEPGEEVEAIGEAELKQAVEAVPDGELERCRDGVFAAYAAYYDRDALAKLPAVKESARNYTAPLLTPSDWAWVHYLDARLAERAQKRRELAQPLAAAKIAAPDAAAARGCGCELTPARARTAGSAWLVLLVCGARRRGNKARA
jgi:hypothetical protein